MKSLFQTKQLATNSGLKIYFFSLVAAIALSGCSFGAQAPDFLIFNSYFPSWLIVSIVAIIITVLLRVVLIRVGVDDFLPARFFFYVAFWLTISIAFSYLYSPR